MVIGLTSDVTARARETGLFAPHGQDNSALTLPILPLMAIANRYIVQSLSGAVKG